MERIKFYDHMQESNSIDPDGLSKYPQAIVEAWGEVVEEDDVRVVLVNTKWYHSDGTKRIEDTWFIVKGAIISRGKA
jgi:predicted phosphohydrolase